MNIVPDKTNLVIAGAFNPAILTPQWILQHVMGREPGEEIPVELLAPINGTGPTRFTFEDFSYTPTSQRLVVYLGALDEQAANERVSRVARILELLPHTPIAAVGFNFAYSSDEVSEAAASLFPTFPELLDVVNEGAEVVVRSWGQTIRLGDEVLGATAKLTGTVLDLGLNFQVSTVSISQVIELLRSQDAFSSRLDKANQFSAFFNR